VNPLFLFPWIPYPMLVSAEPCDFSALIDSLLCPVPCHMPFQGDPSSPHFSRWGMYPLPPKTTVWMMDTRSFPPIVDFSFFLTGGRDGLFHFSPLLFTFPSPPAPDPWQRCRCQIIENFHSSLIGVPPLCFPSYRRLPEHPRARPFSTPAFPPSPDLVVSGRDPL